MATFAPAPAKPNARLLPMRFAAPVTSAVLCCRLFNLLRQRRLLRGFGAVGFALRSGGGGRSSFSVAVKRILLGWPLHLDHDLFAVGVDLVIVAKGLPAVCNYLQTHSVPYGNHVNGDHAVFVALKLERALVLIALHRMEDDGGVGDGLPVGRAQYGDFDGRGRWWRGIFASVMLIRTQQWNAAKQERGSEDPADGHARKYR